MDTSEKLVLDPGYEAVSIPDGRMVYESTGPSVNAPVESSGLRINPHCDLQHETDGGVRLAGGRPGEAMRPLEDLDQRSTSDESTLPPSYCSQYAAMWYVYSFMPNFPTIQLIPHFGRFQRLHQMF